MNELTVSPVNHRNLLFWSGIAALTLAATSGVALAPMLDSTFAFAARVSLLALVAYAAWWDLKIGLVPPAISLPLLAVAFAAALARLVALHDLAFIPYWIGILLLWQLNTLGGGDAKVLLGFFALWPNSQLLWVMLFVHLVVGVILLARKYRRVPLRQVAAGLRARLLARQFIPTEADLAEGERVTFALALALGIYFALGAIR